MLKLEIKEKFKNNNNLRLLIFLIAAILIALMFPRGESIESDVSVGSIWIKDDLIATMPFEILKDADTYKKEKLNAESKVYPVFVIDHSIRNTVIDSIRKFNKKLIKIFKKQLQTKQVTKNTTFLSDESFARLKKIYQLENSLSVENNKSLKTIFGIIIDITNIIYCQ